MRRKIKIVLLTIGMIGGFASGIHSARCHGQWRRESFEQRVARVCVDAARAAESGASNAVPNAAPSAANAAPNAASPKPAD